MTFRYDALYYSYIWSDVKVAETFMEFKKYAASPLALLKSLCHYHNIL